jgi:hypothetical protein
MTMVDLDEQMLAMLRARTAEDRPLTISDFARRFGAPRQIVLSAARRLVDGHLAEPSMLEVQGKSTLHGLQPVLSPDTATAEVL